MGAQDKLPVPGEQDRSRLQALANALDVPVETLAHLSAIQVSDAIVAHRRGLLDLTQIDQAHSHRWYTFKVVTRRKTTRPR